MYHKKNKIIDLTRDDEKKDTCIFCEAKFDSINKRLRDIEITILECQEDLEDDYSETLSDEVTSLKKQKPMDFSHLKKN